jgi:hypothetical protein
VISSQKCNVSDEPRETIGLSGGDGVSFWPPLKELNGVVACKHFEDFQTNLEADLARTDELITLPHSRR